MPRKARAKGTSSGRPGAPFVLEGDCLERLSEAKERAGGAFDLVYVDPPFNAGGKRKARVGGRGERVNGAAAYTDAWGGLDSFLTMLRPRIAAVRDVMSENGALFLHLDFRAVHDAKVLADGVFGRPAFRGEIVWVPGNGARGNGPSVTHQTILVYARGQEMVWNAKDPVLREPFAETSRRMHFRNTDEGGRAYRDRTINGKTYRYYEDEGRRLGSVWLDCPAMNANTPLTRETTGYPTQKPLTLLDRIVRAASLPGARVLDPMCGSGTTVVAAAMAGRLAAGIDQSPLAVEIARGRVAELA